MVVVNPGTVSTRYVLDTNAIVALLGGNKQLVQRLQNAEWVGISIISQLEFLVFTGLTEADRLLFEQFASRVEVIGLDASQTNLLETTIRMRQQYRLRLPDAIVAATAIVNQATLLSADRQLQSISELTVIAF
ncbi:MAG: type II toxin-antitoxin system VapC family toxin [Geitlerinemataceae cyanobacterium]